MHEIILWLAHALDAHPITIFAIATALALLASKKKAVLLLAVLAIAVAVPVAKEVYAQQRPCAQGGTSGICDGWGFPSGHSSIAMAIAIGLLGTPWLFLALPAAYFVGYTRILLYVHSIEQVAGGLSFGLLMFFIIDALVKAAKGARQHKKRPQYRQETRRQLFHMFAGVAFVVAGIWFGILAIELALLAAIFAGIVLINLKMVGAGLGIFEHAFRRLERKTAEFPGRGALFYCVGALFVYSFAMSDKFAFAALSILAISDAASTMVGIRFGKAKLPWNPEKSWAGSIAFFATGAAAAFLFIGWMGVWLAAFLALVETYDFHVDDNLLIPVAAVLFGVAATALVGI